MKYRILLFTLLLFGSTSPTDMNNFCVRDNRPRVLLSWSPSTGSPKPTTTSLGTHNSTENSETLPTETLPMIPPTTHEKTSPTVPTTTKITTVKAATTSKTGEPSPKTTTTIKKTTTTSTPITTSSKTALPRTTTPPITPQKLTTEKLTAIPARTYENTSPVSVPTTMKLTTVKALETSKTGTSSQMTTTTTSAPVPITTSSKKPHPETTTPSTTSQKTTALHVTPPEASTSRTVTETPTTRTSTGKVDLPTTMTTKKEETSSRTSNTVYSSRFFSKPTRRSTVHNGKTVPTTTTTKEETSPKTVGSTSRTSTTVKTESHSYITDEEKTGTSSSIKMKTLTSQATTVVDSTTTTGKAKEATPTIDPTVKTSTLHARTSAKSSSRSHSTVSQHPTDTLSLSKDVTTSQKPITRSDVSSTMTNGTTVTPTTTSDDSEHQAFMTTSAKTVDWTTNSDSSNSEAKEPVSSTKGMTTMKPEERTTESTTQATTGNTGQRTTTAVEEHGNMTDPENVEVRTTTTKTQKSSKGYSSLTSATTPTLTTTTEERIVSSESPSSTVPTKSSTTSLLKTTIVPAQTTTTRSATTSSPHATDTNTTSTVTAGEDKSSTTVSVDTTPRTTLPKHSSSEPSTTMSTTSSTGATETSKVTAPTTSTEEKTTALEDISSSTSKRVTNPQTKISENTSTEKEETHPTATEKKYSRPVTTQKPSTTTQEKELTTTTTELPTSAKQAETTGKISTTSLISSTVPQDTTITKPITQDMETNEKRTTTLDVTTPTTHSDDTEDKPTTNVQQTTGSDLSTSEEQETVTSLKHSTMGESRKPSDTTIHTESGSAEKTSDRSTGTTTRRTTTGTTHDPHSEPSSSQSTAAPELKHSSSDDVHSQPSRSQTTESRRQTDHSSTEQPTTSATGTTGVPHQEATNEKKTVTAHPAEGETVRSSEGTVATSEKSRKTTTAPSGPPVEHFTDINVGDDQSSTTVPDYCSSPCPNGFTEGANYCYMIPPKEKSTTYTLAISFCQMVSGPRSDLATSYDYQDNDNLELFKNMLDEGNRTTELFFVNMLASANFRKNLQAEIILLSSITRFLFPIYSYAGSSQSIEHVNSVCRTTKFCRPNTCSFQQFIDLDKDQVVGLPKRKALNAGESIVVGCIQYNTSQVHTIACAETGSFKVHPSMVNCIAPADFEETDPPSPWNPLFPENCSWCVEVGTESCVVNPEGPGVLCVCKQGWEKRTCWKSPDLCTSETCGEHGQCVSLVDHTECVCEYGMIGERCTVNATKTSWFGTNETLAIWDVRSLGVSAQASSTFILIGLKFLSKILIVGECEDPQDTYQDYRHALQTIGNLAAVFFTHPDMFGVDAIGCRFFFWMITVCYTLGLLFWVNESINVYTTVRAVHRNTWNKNFAGEDKKYLRFAPRVIVPFLIGVFAILLLMANSWNTVGTSWSCFGSFSSDATSTWYPLCAGNAALALLAVSFAEATSLLIKNRPHTLVRLHNWFNLNQPANFEIVGKVERNRYFTAIGPILHFLTWASLTVASDKNTLFMDSMSFFLGMTYVGFNFVQMVFTSPAYYAWACIAAMMILPEKWSPTFEWTNLRNREEVLARYYKRRYKKEQDRKILDEDERKANEQREVDEKNAKLLQKYPNLPSTLLFHCPEEPPVLTLPRPFPFDPSGKEYMTSFQREHLARIWTRSYLETRKFHKKSPEKSAFEVVKKEIQRNIFQVKTEDRKKQELFALAQWWNSVPAMDRTKLREHKNTVIMEDEEETDLIAFEREVSRLASIIDLRENRKRKGLLKDKETDPFKKASDFLKFEPAEAIKCVLFECVDGLGDVRPRKFLKKPPIVLKRQIDEYDKAYSHGVAELNKPFDKTYDDDLMVTQWSDTEHSEAVKEIMNVSPSQIGEQPISMNPRKRPLDEFWFDHERPDFVGPREKHEIPIGPYEEYARKCHYYQSLTDAQWSQIEHNSYHMANLRKIRRGEL